MVIKEPVVTIGGREVTRMGIALPLEVARALRAEAHRRAAEEHRTQASTSAVIEDLILKHLKPPKKGGRR